MLTLVENYFLHEHLLVMSSRSAKYGAFLRTGGRGTSRPRCALQRRQLELLQGFAQCHCTQVIMIVHERMLELNCFYSLLCLTKFILLQSSLKIHLIRIALTYCGTLTREEGRDLRGGQEFRCLKRRASSVQRARSISRATTSASTLRPVFGQCEISP